jgi:hypothetical protein
MVVELSGAVKDPKDIRKDQEVKEINGPRYFWK